MAFTEALPVEPGSIWRHTKTGNHYVVRHIAKMEADERLYVVYRRVDPALPQIWLRPAEEWQAMTVHGPRFVPVKDT